jgi:hypothetical protein
MAALSRALPALLAATSLHAAVLGGAWWHAGGRPGAGHDPQAQAHTRSAAVWQWRLVPARSTAPAPPLAQAAGVTPPGQPAEPPAAAATPASPQATTDAPPAGTQAQRDDYLPRSALTKAPMARGPIDIPFPPGVPTPGRYSAVLALYIDEQGNVRRVRPTDGELPGAYQEAARNAFQAGAFSPGEVQGVPVKAVIQVEVVFDDRGSGRGLSASQLAQR